ncbi:MULTISPECIES: hypothetical protein [Carnobacterium]|uniref:hypothetical protein n=1 Tax=Carnobacterium TaxID=2747 RepID=UPI002890A088|nr:MULTISPECIES: hypothetical protein [Carnobacterium]MDT1940253.1 hypothetical protein [Carnobacterium divergens]MDT1942691.1 hypothetical protein [Carnobacterium divergens]MDT1948497.1 hypothetical protein [Carnobacterium divergens]MDT1950978.1 hypothetical protein [Carnobacterium divergens]MDT1955808.1 hypothetical protein [Carnobacterium divergens]
MKSEIESIYNIYDKLNKNFDNKLINTGELRDLKENVIDCLEKDFEYLKKGLAEFEKLNFEELTSSKDSLYTLGVVNLSKGLVNIIGDLQDLEETLNNMNRKFMLLSNEITE